MSNVKFSDTRKSKGRPRVDSFAIMLRVPPNVAGEIDRAVADWGRTMGHPCTRQELIRAWIESALHPHRMKWARDDARRKAKPRRARTIRIRS